MPTEWQKPLELKTKLSKQLAKTSDFLVIKSLTHISYLNPILSLDDDPHGLAGARWSEMV